MRHGEKKEDGKGTRMKKITKITAAAMSLGIMLAMAGCQGASGSAADVSASQGAATASFSDYDLTSDYDEATASKAVFSESGVQVSGEGAAAEGTVLKITKAGTYIISGSCSDGQVIVETDKSAGDKVQLVLNGLNLTSKKGAPLCVNSADKTLITLAEGSQNSFADAVATDAAACVYSADDLTINGSGTLNVAGNVNNAIGSKNDLKIVSGSVNVTAANNGIKGNDAVLIRNGEINIKARKDGIKADNETDADKGYIYIEGGNIVVNAGDDGLQSVTAITITGGMTSVVAEGKIMNCDGKLNVDSGCITQSVK